MNIQKVRKVTRPFDYLIKPVLRDVKHGVKFVSVTIIHSVFAASLRCGAYLLIVIFQGKDLLKITSRLVVNLLSIPHL